MSVSSTAAVVMEVERLKSQGIEVIDFGAGEPDFPTPENIKQAAHRAIDANFTKYTATAGTVELKRAIINRIESDFGVSYTPQQVITSIGGKQVLFNAIVSLIDPGDQVLIPSPYWVTFPEIVYFAGGEPVLIDTESNGFQLTAEMVEEKITPRTKLLILNSPCNPSGRVIPTDEFLRIAELAISRGLYIISDECYVKFTYPPYEPFSAATLPEELRLRTLIAGTFSKTYAMTGWRIGYALGPAEWVSAMLKVQSHSTSNPTSISQKAAIEAFTGPQESVREMLDEYKRRRDWLIPALNNIPGVTCAMPEGAFYAYPNVKAVLEHSSIKTSKDLEIALLKEAHVALTAGSAFGTEGYLRLSYANSLDTIKRGVEQMHSFISKLMA